MNKTIKTILILSVGILILTGTYYIYNKNSDSVPSVSIDNNSSSYLSKISIDGIKYDSLISSDREIFEIFKHKLEAEYKSNGNTGDVATDTISILYIDDKSVLFRIAGYGPCNSVVLISKLDNNVLSRNCFVSEYVNNNYILSIDDSQGIVAYKAGSDKISEISNSILGGESNLTYSSIDTYHSPDPVKSKPNFIVASNTLTIDTYKRLDNSFVKKVSFELP